MTWSPPSTFGERLKRALIPPRMELARIVRRELKKGEPELHLVARLADPDALALDIGANRGIWTHVMARHARRVIAFEPNPKLFSVLRRALPANAEARPLALSDTDGEASLLVPKFSGGYSNQGASLNPKRVEGHERGEMTVATARLDSLALPRVGLMKIDVEGHEAAVLRGAEETLRRDRPRLIVEIEERHTGIVIEEALAAVEGLGYRGFFLDAGGGLIPVSRLDGDRQHRQAAGKPGYVNNFIFMPDV